MLLDEKKEELVRREWEAFGQVQNEGGRAGCQDDKETFFRMRRSQFAPWTGLLTDSYLRDMQMAEFTGRNLVSEKYAWMIKRTAPERFRELRHLLPEVSRQAEDLIDQIVGVQLGWMEAYQKQYPNLALRGRMLSSEEDTSVDTSFETYLWGELHTYSEETLLLYGDFVKGLEEEGKNLWILVMEATAGAYGYQSLKEAEKQMKKGAEETSQGL
jgi:hypothetical protein